MVTRRESMNFLLSMYVCIVYNSNDCLQTVDVGLRGDLGVGVDLEVNVPILMEEGSEQGPAWVDLVMEMTERGRCAWLIAQVSICIYNTTICISSNYVFCLIQFASALIIAQSPEDRVGEIGMNASFICAINGSTEGIEWLDEDGLLMSDDEVAIVTDNNGFDYNSTLTLTSITNSSYQTYTCRGRNEMTTVSASAVLGECTIATRLLLYTLS